MFYFRVSVTLPQVNIELPQYGFFTAGLLLKPVAFFHRTVKLINLIMAGKNPVQTK
jgi:hypothetical protein